MVKKLEDFDTSDGVDNGTTDQTDITGGAGSNTSLTGFDPAAYLAANADVAAEYNSLSPGYLASLGIRDAQGFAAWHYANKGVNENRPGSPNYKAPDAAPGDASTPVGQNETATADGGVVNTPVPTSTPDLLTSITGTYNDTIGALSAQAAAQTAQIGNLATSLTGAITAQQQSFAQSQSDLLNRFTSATADQSAQMTKALKDLQDNANSTGQAAKKPNYARALAKNRELNGNGLSSTMVTGPGGVTNQGTLGTTALLGA